MWKEIWGCPKYSYKKNKNILWNTAKNKNKKERKKIKTEKKEKEKSFFEERKNPSQYKAKGNKRFSQKLPLF